MFNAKEKNDIQNNIINQKLEAKYIEGIRKRISFKNWKNIHEFLKKKPTSKEILLFIFEELDASNGFGSYQKAGYSYESLMLYMKDKNMKVVKNV